jgi:hypothetical protein
MLTERESHPETHSLTLPQTKPWWRKKTVATHPRVLVCLIDKYEIILSPPRYLLRKKSREKLQIVGAVVTVTNGGRANGKQRFA